MEDPGAEAAWVDSIVNELVQAMPNLPVQDVLGILSEMLSPWNLQIEPLLDSRLSCELLPTRYSLRNHCRGTISNPARGLKRSRGRSTKSEESCDDTSENQRNRRLQCGVRITEASTEDRSEACYAGKSKQNCERKTGMNLIKKTSRKTDKDQAKDDHHTKRIVDIDRRLENGYGEMNADELSRDLQQISSGSDSLQQHQQQMMMLHRYRSRIAGEDDDQQQKMTIRNTEFSRMEDEEEEGLQILSLLLQCAEAVSVDNLDEANSIIPHLNSVSSPFGNPVQRVVAYFTEAMAARILSSSLGICSALPSIHLFHHQSFSSAFQTFNGICPFVKFSHFTANQAILEAFEGHDKVHIIDCDIMQGLQWPALFNILASRPEGPPCVRITGIGTSLEVLEATGTRLSDFARNLKLPFEFQAIAERVGNLDRTKLKVSETDAVAVHWLQHSLYDVTGSDDRTIELLQELRPKIVTIVEQDLSHGGAFVNRFVEALHYYSALFDALGGSFSEGNLERHTVEQQLLSSEIKNILAVGGPARSGEMKFENWREAMNGAGFKQVSLAGNAATQASLLLKMFDRNCCDGSSSYSLMIQEGGALKLGWKDLGLYIASAWSSSSQYSDLRLN